MPVPFWEYVNKLRHGKHKINSDNVISEKGSVEHFDYSLVLRTSNFSIDASDKRLDDYNNDMAKEKEKAKAAAAERCRKMSVAKKNIKEEFSNFFKETSFTALVQIYKAKSFWRRVAWTLLVLGMLTWLTIQCFWLVERYFSYQMEVKLDMQATTELEFPSVTICNLNPIRVSSTNHYPYTDLQQYVKPDTSDMLYSETLRTWEFDGQCPHDEIQCSNGQCISPYSMCDGINDCYNNYDEENCADYICPNDTWKCPSGLCLDITGRCDGEIDCSDGADEADCSSNVCPSNYTRCTSGKCIVMSWLCDGFVDCPDAGDENNCPDVSCSSAEFKCSTVNICIPGTFACDGMDDCTDGSDESGCASYSCLPTHVKCNTSHLCIQKSWICDTINDCGDNEDESKCYIPGSGSGSGSSTVGYYGSSTQSGSGSFTSTPATIGTLGSSTQQTIGSTTQQATGAPTQQTIASPTQQPTGAPTQQTIASPTQQPTGAPTQQTIASPTQQPTGSPTQQTIASPTQQPTGSPTQQPTGSPTQQPTGSPTQQPTGSPTQQPTGSPTQQPTGSPTQQPIASPTQQTVGSTTQQPIGSPTQQTIASPTQQPTVSTTQQPGVSTTQQPGGFPTTTTQGLPSTDPLNNPTTTTTSATGGSTISGTTNIGQSTPSPLASSSTMSTSTAFAGRRRKRSVVEDHVGSDGGTHTHLEERKWSHYSAARLRHEEYHKQIENKIARHRDEWVKNKAKKLKDQRIKEIQDDYIKYLGNKFRKEEEDSATTQKESKRRKRRAPRPTEAARTPEEINWDALLSNSTFNKWDMLELNNNVSSRFYEERDDEYEAAMTYAYITARLDPAEVEQSGHKKTDLIAACKFGGYQCSPNNFTYFHSHKYGNCYTFNSRQSSSSTLKTRFPGPENGLRLELFLDQDQYVANLATEAGIRVLIHHKGTMPFPEDEGISIMPGRSTNIGMRQISFSRLVPPHGVCGNSGKREDYYVTYRGTDYTKLSCLKSCYQDLAIKHCQCAVPLYIVPNNQTVCNMTNKATEDCVTWLTNRFPASYKACDEMCPLPCSEFRYDVTISMAEWPSDQYSMFLSEKLGQTNVLYRNADSEKEFTKLQIYYQDLLYQYIEQQKAYESMNLISDLGGQLGLWLGLSAITIGELCSFLFSVGRSLPSTCCGSKTKPSENTPVEPFKPATLEEMYEDMCPAPAKYIPPDIVTASSEA